MWGTKMWVDANARKRELRHVGAPDSDRSGGLEAFECGRILRCGRALVAAWGPGGGDLTRNIK